MAEYVRQSNKLLLRGMNITLPGDRLGMEWAQLLRNLRSYRIGEWRQRPALHAEFDTGSGSPVLWLGRLNSPSAGTSKLLAATQGGQVFDDSGSLLDSSYGAQGYSAAVARPDASPNPFVLLANATRQSKFDVNGARTEWGLAAPNPEPIAEIELPAFATVNECVNSAGFAATNGAVSTQARVSSTISYILYDVGTSRWACCAPAAMDQSWQEGMYVDLATETVIVSRVFPAIADTTVESIAYDSGSTGQCCVQLSVPTLGLQRDMLLLLNGEPVRVLSVTQGLDGVPSFRCSTVGTVAAGDAVTGLRSFRAVFSLPHLAGDTLQANFVQLACSGAGLSAVSKVEAHDLSQTTNTYVRPMQPDDFVHISFFVNDWALVTELQLQFDVDATSNDFAHNYYFKSIRPPDLQVAIDQSGSSLTAQQQEIQRQQIDALSAERQQLIDSMGSQGGTGSFFGVEADRLRQQQIDQIDAQLAGMFLSPTGDGSLSSPGTSGMGQWTELKIPIKEFERVGSDSTRGWQNVAAFQVTANVTAAVDIGIHSLWIGGTFGPDFQAGQVYTPNAQVPTAGLNYVYRFRNTQTGSCSPFSPPMRSPVYPHREGVLIRGDAAYADPQADVCDYFRIGGTLGNYHYVGTAPVNDLTLLDTIDDSVAVRNEIAQFDRFKPWPTVDLPQSGTCDVVGTSVTIVTGALDTRYTRNNIIIVDGRAYTFYSAPASSTQVQLNESAGTLTGVTWEIPNPQKEGTPLPVVFGPYGGGQSGEFWFGLGDTTNPGYLYYTLGNDPEACSDAGYLELSSPNEPLIGGTILDGIIFVWSVDRSWRVLPSFEGGQSGAGSLFYAQETAMGKGLASPWGVAAGDQLYWVAWDGVWSSRGDAIQSLTDESLSPLFRREGTEAGGGPWQGLAPISFAQADLRYLSLTYSKDGLYLTYLGTDGGFYNLYYSFLTQGWINDTFPQALTRLVREEGDAVDAVLAGSTDGKAWSFDSGSSLDDGQPLQCVFDSREELWNDTRAQKLVGDVMVDCAPGGNTLIASLQVDNGSGSVALASITGTTRNQTLLDINSGGGWLARTAGLLLSWQTLDGCFTYLYEWQPSALIKPESADRRATDWDYGGYMGNKWLQGVRITCDTYGQLKSFRVETDGAFNFVQLTTLTLGEQTVAFSWTPGTTHQMRLVGEDDLPWRIMRIEWIWEPEPELARYWDPQVTSLDQQGFSHIRDVLIAHRSFADVFMFVDWDDGGEDSYLIPSSAGERAKTYLPLQAKKGKVVNFRFFSAEPCSLYLKDCEVRTKSWGLGQPYQVFRPFGDLTRENGGARI